jgi:K+-transporting ATPase ATPase C chain
MIRHVRANLLLLALTLLLCTVLYPAVLWAIGQVVFREEAQGSLVKDKKGDVVGSRLIGQPFTQDKYFWPRPSATTPAYNAAASGASNYGASNPALRDRVELQLGPLITYMDGSPVGPDVVRWFREELAKDPKALAGWAKDHANLADHWVKASEDNAKFLDAWKEKHADLVAAWHTANPDKEDGPKGADLALVFFQTYKVDETPEAWTKGDPADLKDLQSVFYPLWREAHAGARLKDVPADLVMSSGSGLDPHITLDGALYQLRRVADAWAKASGRKPDELRKEIEDLLHQKAGSPLSGLAGVPLVNVLEVNLALKDRYGE